MSVKYPDKFIEYYWMCNNGEMTHKEFRKKMNLTTDEFDRYYRTYDAEQLFKNEKKNIAMERKAKKRSEPCI